jgi:YfiH family protein
LNVSNPARAPTWLTPDWPVPGNVRAISTLRGGGASVYPYSSLNLASHVGDVAAAVAANRRALKAAASLPSEPAWLTQVHGTRVADLDRAPPLEADAAMTRQPKRVCAVLTADCLPVLLAGEAGECVAAVHVGWRGLAAGIIESTVRALPTPPRRLLAWLGPAIGPRRFEIGPEVREALVRGEIAAGLRSSGPGVRGPGVEAAFSRQANDRYTADLYLLARRRLEQLGLQRICGGGDCTFSQGDKYFSHRRDLKTGRQATLIWLE